jgi:hypothetical protein
MYSFKTRRKLDSAYISIYFVYTLTCHWFFQHHQFVQILQNTLPDYLMSSHTISFCGAAIQIRPNPSHFSNFKITIRHTRAVKISSELVISLLLKFYLHNTQQTQETNIHTLSGIRNRNRSDQTTTPYTTLHSLLNAFIARVCKLYKYLGPDHIYIKTNKTE